MDRDSTSKTSIRNIPTNFDPDEGISLETLKFYLYFSSYPSLVFLSLPTHWHGLFEFFQQLFLIGNGSSFIEYQNVLSKTKVKEQLKYLKLIIQSM